MPTPPVSRELAEQAVAALDVAMGNQTNAAEALGVARSTFQNRLKAAARYGLMGFKPVPHGFEVSGISSGPNGEFVRMRPERSHGETVPEGHVVAGVSTLLDEQGRVALQWVKTREERTALDIAEVLAKRFENYVPSATVSTPPTHTNQDLLTLIPCNDWHVGMFSWNRETGANWDLRIAEDRIGQGIEDAISRSPEGAMAIVLGGGDLTHADNNQNQTSRSSNKLDVDGRHQKIVECAGNLMVRTVDAALRRNDHVIVRNLKGNHDEETAPAVAWFLKAWYRNDPRVTVDLDQSLFFYHRFGKVMIAATHGHEAKLKDMPSIMAHRRAEDWGATQFRYAHGFHVHHQSKFATEGGGVIMESHQAPIPQDAWHFGSGFLSGRSLQTITYHRNVGEVSRVRVTMMES